MSVNINCVPDCLKDIIGYRSHCETEPVRNPCKVYIEDLPNFNIQFLAEIADLNNEQSGDELAITTIRNATLAVLNNLHEYLFKINRLSLNNLLEAINFGTRTDNYYIPAPYMRGIVIEKDIDSEMSKIHISLITIHAHTSGEVILRIEDGSHVTSELIQLQANIPFNKYINKIFESKQVTITVNNTSIQMYSTDVISSKSCCGSSKNSTFLSAYGWDGIKRTNDSFGITVKANVVCDITPLACALANQLSMPILYQFGIKIFEAIITSNRINGAVEKQDLARYQLKDYNQKYDYYMKYALNASSQMLKYYDNQCLSCAQSRWATIIP